MGVRSLFNRKTKLKLSGTKLRDGSRIRGLLSRLRKTHYFIFAGVIAFTIIQPSYLMSLFNLFNPPKVTPLHSEEVFSSRPKPIGSFTPVLYEDPEEAAKKAAVKYENVNDQGVPEGVERVRELTDMRTANTSTYLNSDGTKTLQYRPIQTQINKPSTHSTMIMAIQR